jgi:hypothetical protein
MISSTAAINGTVESNNCISIVVDDFQFPIARKVLEPINPHWHIAAKEY